MQVLDENISEMTYNVLMGTLNPTHSLTHSLTHPVESCHAICLRYLT